MNNYNSHVPPEGDLYYEYGQGFQRKVTSRHEGKKSAIEKQ